MREREEALFQVISWTLEQYDDRVVPFLTPGKRSGSTPSANTPTGPSIRRWSSVHISGDDGAGLTNIDYSGAPREVVLCIEGALRAYGLNSVMDCELELDSQNWLTLNESQWKSFLKQQNRNFKLMVDIMMAATQTSMCWVFDMEDPNPNATNLDGAMLECVLHSAGSDDKMDKV